MGRARIEPRPGTYALILACNREGWVRAGRLAPFAARPGTYLYVGSAFGPGGVRARIEHHARVAARPHWHVDALRRHTGLEAVWYTHDARRCEHLWARLLAEMRSDEVMAGIALGLQNQEPAIVALTKMVKYLTGRLEEVSKE